MRNASEQNRDAVLITDDDEGPWSQTLPLGVYRITGDACNADNGSTGSSVKQLPLYDAPDNDSNIIDFLVCNQCLEIVETQVLVMKNKKDKQQQQREQVQNHHIAGMNDGPGAKHVVRARCMVPVIVSPLCMENLVGGAPVTERKFRSGWITLSETGGKNSEVTATPIAAGAYVVKTNDPLLSCDSNSRIKSILPSGSCMEVDATRIEFERKEKLMKCSFCGRKNMYHSVAVRALIGSGGFVTLFIVSVGVSGTAHSGGLCSCGRLVQEIYAEPVPLGTYRVVKPAFLTQGSGNGSNAITHLKEGAFVHVTETRVEEGCVRGRVEIAIVANNGNASGQRIMESMSGWVSLFEPPSFRWAELVVTKS